jgi:hypothetical protein
MTEHNWPEEGTMDPDYEPPSMALSPQVVEQHVHHEHFIERERARVFDDERELRAYCVNSAISTKNNTFSVKDDELAEAAEKIIEVAKVYEAYINGSNT